MKVLILSFSNNIVNEDSFIPNKKGLTFACVDECINHLEEKSIGVEHICINDKNIKRCMACGPRGWGDCLKEHKCALDDDFNEIREHMGEFDGFILITPVYFWEMSESAKTFLDKLKRCDAFNKDSKLKGKKLIVMACAGGSGNGTENTLKAFDAFNHFMNMDMIGRIPVTRMNYKDKTNEMKKCIDKFNK